MGVIKININTIVNYINERLAGEQLLYSQLLVFLDGTIDDINQALNSNFPAFSEFSEKDENYPDYNFFPDRYIRTVVVTGACAKFYICDEEGAAVAEQYQYEYKDYLSASIILCGVDNLEGPCIYSVGLGGTTLKQNIAMSGSGSTYVFGYIDNNYKPNMTKQEAKDFLRNAVALAMYRDNHSGGTIRMLDITKDSVTRDYIPFDQIKFPQDK